MLKGNHGQASEQAAITYLQQQGLRLVARNVRFIFGEIDIIMKEGTVWVFVEVKYRSNLQFGGAINALSQRQQDRIKRAASHYLQLKQINAICRFDFIAIDPNNIEWIRDAF
ncbi:YraN family protein [uncultured Shewanella sp.]|uniref:YraN family protein n=1 Tax=uncultured Shewanella sp. TaxID=173975 RepID=UPI002616644E|nr:YraN family protein [uncultured Shewanella sp.]